MKRKGQKVHRQEVLEWLKARPDLWSDLDPQQLLWVTQRARWNAIVKELKEAKLYSQSTNAVDVPIRRLILTLKNEKDSQIIIS